MRFWTAPPEPGSLEEVIATSVELFDEYRQYEYMVAGVLSSMYAAARTKESQEAVEKMLGKIEEKYFGPKHGTSSISDKEKDDFKGLMENTYARISGSKLREAAAVHGHPQARGAGKPVVYARKPKGTLLP